MNKVIEQLEAYGYEVVVGPEEMLVIDHMSKQYYKGPLSASFEEVHKELNNGGVN